MILLISQDGGFFFEGFGSGVDACMDGGMHRPVCFSNELKTSS